MSCPHIAVDVILNKDKKDVYEVCSYCNRLVTMAPFNEEYDKKPYYITTEYNFKDLFELKENGLRYKPWGRTIYADKDSEAQARYFLYKPAVIKKEKLPKFFTNMNRGNINEKNSI